MRDLAILILAAGKGTRMRSRRSKLLHPLSGKPVLSYSLETAISLKPKRLALIVGHQADEVRDRFQEKRIEWVLQKQQLGTAHAVQAGLKGLEKFRGAVLILSGDVPLLTTRTLRQMIRLFERQLASLVLLTMELGCPTGYGRIVRDDEGEIVRIVEEKEATAGEKLIPEVNAGIYLAQSDDLQAALQGIKKSRVKKEYYLTDIVGALVQREKKVISVCVDNLSEVMGINSQSELALADEILQERIREEWMVKGVTMIDPESIRIESDVKLAPDVVLHPGVILSGKTTIKSGAEILPYSVIEDSVVKERAKIGPFSHLRPKSIVEEEAHVGNFVELKKTRLGKGSKANHLSYLGDTVIGKKTNIGAGTITCNYDGKNKFQTKIEDGAFIGSNTELVAPVTVGKWATTGAGTTVTKNVPDGALAVSRTAQKNVLNWKKKKC